MELELFWKGPYKINIETPEGEKGKHGLYVFFYDSEIIYIGIAAGAMHLYQESKFRYRPLKRAFVELGVANEQIKREHDGENFDLTTILFIKHVVRCLETEERIDKEEIEVAVVTEIMDCLVAAGLMKIVKRNRRNPGLSKYMKNPTWSNTEAAKEAVYAHIKKEAAKLGIAI